MKSILKLILFFLLFAIFASCNKGKYYSISPNSLPTAPPPSLPPPILSGDTDGNPNTTSDHNWKVLVFPISPIADHPSAHAAAGGAAAELLKQFFEKDEFDFSFESSSLPGNPRSFNSFSQAARENSLSRIYVGYHFRKACMDGEALGNNVGSWIAAHSLQEN